jgi:coenzyme F420-reducing hydrogenase alpha subunit
MHNFNLELEHITKIEGAASLSVCVKNNKVKTVQFKTTEYKRFFTEAMKGKPIIAIPQLLARICGTCSNAHLLCSIEACERALHTTPTEQTLILRFLAMYGLMIRDHALHLYLFALPDIYNKDSLLEFEENDIEQHQLLHDAFEMKSVGNFLSNLIAGRSVHAVHPTIGGFLHFPEEEGISQAVKKLEAIRPAAVRLIDIFQKARFHFDRQTKFMALVPERYGFLNGSILTSDGENILEKYFRKLLEHTVLPYSQASGYKYKGGSYMVGALARINLAKDRLHNRTKETLIETLKLFPSTNIFHNNLAQAIEILHSIDDAIDILTHYNFKQETIIKNPPSEGVGVGVIEAPRGTLYHKVVIDANGIVKEGEIVVPTGQNQINIEEDIRRLVEELLSKMTKKQIIREIEKLIRAYDPCMSCASHFLEVQWI